MLEMSNLVPYLTCSAERERERLLLSSAVRDQQSLCELHCLLLSAWPATTGEAQQHHRDGMAGELFSDIMRVIIISQNISHQTQLTRRQHSNIVD